MIIFNCNSDLPKEPITDDPLEQGSLEKKTAKEYWFSDYFPLNPYLYGIKTYELTVGGSGQFTSEIVGTEIVPYTSGAIEGVKVDFGGDPGVVYSDKENLWFVSDGDYILSTTCGNLEAFPPQAIMGKVYDGMILDRSGTYWKVNANNYNDCIAGGDDADDLHLISIQDVYINGKRYNNSIIVWDIDPGVDFISLDFNGKEQELGLRLPSADETNNSAIDDVGIWGHRVGILAQGDITRATGKLNTFFELVSITRN
jgi:hypothetical protein